MQSIKIGWHGRAFAMAKNNENEGKRSRNRISKEERKKMTVSFIKKYQILNGGSFPSLNLTQKEVGGSFYTTREIVREIIQENKILGSGDLFLIDNKNHSSVEMPSGTILELDIGKPSHGEAASEDEDSTHNLEVHAMNNVSSVDIPTHTELTGCEGIIVNEGSDEMFSTSHDIEFEENGSRKVISSENVPAWNANSPEVSSSMIFTEDSIAKVVSASYNIEDLQTEVEESDSQKINTSENVLSLDSNSSELSSLVNAIEDSNTEMVSASHMIENPQVEDKENGSQMAITSKPALEAITPESSSSTIEDSNKILVSTSSEIENLQTDVENASSQNVSLSESMPTLAAMSSEVSSSMIAEEENPQMVPLSEKIPTLVSISSEMTSSMIVEEETPQMVPLSENASTLSSSMIVEEESSQKVLSSENTPLLGPILLERGSSTEDLAASNSESEELKNNAKRAEVNGESDKGKLGRIHIETWEGPSRQDLPPILAAWKSFVHAIVKYFTT